MGLLKQLNLRQGRLSFLSLFLFLISSVPLQADTAFLRQLADKPVVSFADAVSMITQFHNQENQYPDFESQKNFLQQEGLLSKRLAAKKADEVIRKGDLAEIAVKSLNIQGGMMLRLVRPWIENRAGHYLFQRYALKETVFLDFMKNDDIRSIVSGLELIGTVSKMSEYRSGEA